MHPTQLRVTDPTDPATASPVTPTVTPAGTLRSASLYLARYGWVRGAYYDGTATVFTPPACMVGAIGMVCYGGPVDAPALNFDDPGFADFDEALDWLDAYLSEQFGLIAYEFNDARGTCRADVVFVLDEAADAWDRSHPAPVVHADYPHEPGTLYDCPSCEVACFCTGDVRCVYCAIEAESADGESTPGGGA